MNENIRIQLLTLAQGGRIIRLEDDATGLSVERKVHPDKPLVAQKASLMSIFETLVKSESAAA